MDKNKIEQKKPGSNQKGVEEDSPLRLTADLGTICWMSGRAR